VYALPISTVQEVAEIKKLLLIHNHPFIEVMIALLSCYAPRVRVALTNDYVS
jgi:hypothetical protein